MATEKKSEGAQEWEERLASELREGVRRYFGQTSVGGRYDNEQDGIYQMILRALRTAREQGDKSLLREILEENEWQECEDHHSRTYWRCLDCGDHYGGKNHSEDCRVAKALSVREQGSKDTVNKLKDALRDAAVRCLMLGVDRQIVDEWAQLLARASTEGRQG